MKFKIGDRVMIKRSTSIQFTPATQSIIRGIGKIMEELGEHGYWLVNFNNGHHGFFFPEGDLKRAPNTQLLFEFMG